MTPHPQLQKENASWGTDLPHTRPVAGGYIITFFDSDTLTM